MQAAVLVPFPYQFDWLFLHLVYNYSELISEQNNFSTMNRFMDITEFPIFLMGLWREMFDAAVWL